MATPSSDPLLARPDSSELVLEVGCQRYDMLKAQRTPIGAFDGQEEILHKQTQTRLD